MWVEPDGLFPRPVSPHRGFRATAGVSSGYQATKSLNAFSEEFRPEEYDDPEVMYFYGQARA